MNMIKGRLQNGAFFAADGTQWPLATNGHARPDGNVVYGIRPEHLVLDPQGLPARVVVIEPTGSETQVVLRVGETTFQGAFRERVAARPDEILPVRPDLNLVHLFDAESGRRI